MAQNTPPEIVTVLEQLGGQRIFAMAFDRAVWAGCENTTDANRPRVILHVARGLKVNRRIRWVKIELASDDTYRVQFSRWNKRSAHEEIFDDLSCEMVQADQLRGIVERALGCYLTLGTMGAHQAAQS